MRTLRKQAADGDKPRQFHSVTEVARMFGMSPMTLYRAIEEMVEAALADQGLIDAAEWVPEQRHGRGV